MMTQPKYNILTSSWFIIGLTVLLINDFYLKYNFPSVLTGKLSDFAGLFIFPIFISVFISRPKAIYILTSIFFIFWKLEYSQTLINTLINFTNLGFHRTVDVTDLIALTVLPISYKYLKSKENSSSQNQFVFSVFIAFISIFSFCATTLPRQTFKADIKVNKTFELPISKEALFKQLNHRYGYSDTFPKNMVDTLFYLYFQIPAYSANVTAIATIKSVSDDMTIIKLDSIINYQIMGRLFRGIKQSNIEACKKLKAADFETIFESNYIDFLLQKKKSKRELFFDNKELIDKYFN